MTTYHVFDHDKQHFTHEFASRDELEAAGLDDSFSVVEVLEAAPGNYILEADQYYSSFGVLRLTITQPKDRALRMFEALLITDTKLEAAEGWRRARLKW